MAATLSGKKRGRGRSNQVLQKPRGVISPRVEKVGPHKFGVVAIDVAKARSKWMLCDFYGKVIVEPTTVEHNRAGFDAAIASLKKAVADHGIADLLVAVERTGRYHHAPARAFAAAGFEVRTVHPLATKQFRQPANPGDKTDDNDMFAISRAAINGFALAEPQLDESWRRLQLLVRHRRDLVVKSSILCCQIKEHLHAALPGFAACFPTLWEHPAALTIALQVGDGPTLANATCAQLASVLEKARIRFQQRTLNKVIEWAKASAAPDMAAAQHRLIAADLEADRQRKIQQILALERDIAHLLCATPYVLLMSIVGINVVSAAEYAAEMGPMAHYANARCITGRAGLFPSRYQSDQVDLSGPLVRRANRRLRFAILMISDNLISCNHYFNALAQKWRDDKDDARVIRVRVAQRFCRISYQMIAGGNVFEHPCARGRDYVLKKLVEYHTPHQTGPMLVQRDLHNALAQLPKAAWADEAKPLQEELNRLNNSHRGPQQLGEILLSLLASLGVQAVQSPPSGNTDPT